MRSEKITRIEKETLATFQEEIPSIYFSDKSEAEFRVYSDNAAWMYRNLFKFPPQMFKGANLIDFGAGTGENTVSLARWGASCTLVEMNPQALAIAQEVFSRYAHHATGLRKFHSFIKSSIFDFESTLKYDIVHCRGVLSHTADKEGAFRKIASFLKQGGFLIFGDPNKAGGFQNMLQRFAVYQHANTWGEMEKICEKLFKEDIDRSQLFVNRTRRSIIFDRWVIQNQDDPSVEEVMSWLSENGLTLYSSYPSFIMPLIGDSVHHRPKFDAAQTKGMATIAETVWLLQNGGDRENVQVLNKGASEYAERLSALTGYIANLNSSSSVYLHEFNKLADATVESFENIALLRPLETRLSEFISEAKQFVRVVLTSEPDEIKAYIDSCKHLFKGACGVRHVDFIAYKE